MMIKKVMPWNIDFDSQILALFDTSPLNQLAKLKHFLCAC